jgi:hypothetical protein
MIETIDDLYARCDLVQDNVNRAFASNRDLLHLTLAIEEMEMVIRAAIAGEAPTPLPGARSVPMSSY